MNPTTSSQSGYASYKGWSIALGIVLMIFGLLILGAQVFTTYVSITFLGWMLVVSGVVEFVYSFFAGSYERTAYFFIGSVFSFIIGALIIAFPGLSASTFTLMIGVFMIIVGVYKTFSSIFSRPHNWGWSLFVGLLTIIFGFMILARWPVSGTWVIGLLIGIEIFLSGFSQIVNIGKPAEENEFRYGGSMDYGLKGGSSEKNDQENEVYSDKN